MNGTFDDHREGCQCQQCKWLKDIAHSFREVVTILKVLDKSPRSGKLGFKTSKGVSNMPISIPLGAPFTAVLTEQDASGNTVPDVGPVTYSSSNTAVANPDPVAGTGTGLSVGTATITGTDAGDNIVASDTLTVTDVATQGTLTLTGGPQSAVKKA